MHTAKELADQLWPALKEQLEKPAYRLIPSSGTPTLTGTKIGGTPYWPKGKPYPTAKDGSPLYLVAQLNMADFPEGDLLPKAGVLQFFVKADEQYGFDWKEGSADGYRVVHHGAVDEASANADVPKASEEEAAYLPFCGSFAMRVESMRCMPCVYEEVFVDALDQELARRGLDLDEGTRDDLIQEMANFTESDGSHVLGYPFTAQGNPVEEGDPHDVLLLNLDGTDWLDDGNFLEFGDSGYANFFIAKDALLRGDFADVLYTWDCY